MRVLLVVFFAVLAVTAQAAKPLVYCTDASPEGFDPGLWDSTSTSNVNNQMFQGLLGFQRGGTQLVPKLATGWEVSSDATVFTFTLRPGVAFHRTDWFTPSRALNADDVLFTYQRFIDPQHPYNQAFPANFIYPQALGLARQIARIEKLDAHRVRFTLREPNVTFLSTFAMSFAGIQSAEYAAQLLREGKASQINRLPVGTGPYQFRRYEKDHVVRMQAHPGYWGGRQRTEALLYSISREPAVRVQKLIAGECQVTSPIRDVDVTSVRARPQVRLEKIQALNISYLAFNLKRPRLSDRRVREALDIAIDRDAIFKAIFPRGDALQAVSAFPPSIPGYNHALKNEFNPERARQLLTQAGLGEGFELDLWALPVARPTNPNGQLLAQLIQHDWARIGVRARIKTYEWGEYLKRANNGEHDIYMSGWSGDSGDADDFLTPNLSCAANKTGVKFCHPDFERLIDEARRTTDPAARNRLYEEAQALFKRERPWITLAHSTIYIPVRSDVQGFTMAPNGSVDFEGVYRE
ncbi:ABC transporter substrate-binding protein [Inhella gelatinilytica]|uniref:ABC transporter substrate-binding protein n=1 Tax=Inhella gelatinilytica TaxID=2795030 RepID=A0A931ITS8_9BURK|nr:ABC transporter substrate-binding protein [Inhella gelatinilytica]MBH9552595.1 ABC transporter substrate-binding protein [Inhella gelatinilytica]